MIETIDKLYLELSQVSDAKTANDLKLERIEEIMRIFKDDYESPAMRIDALQQIWSVIDAN